jgi:ribosomal protein S18 acetylase RimI-like enzyme
MNHEFTIRISSTTSRQIAAFLHSCDPAFVSELSRRVVIEEYAAKLAEKSVRLEAWCGDRLVGLAATYCNDSEGRAAFITSISVLPDWQRLGLGSRLVAECIKHAKLLEFAVIRLEVDSQNCAAMRIYQKLGFVVDAVDDKSITMNLILNQT